MLSGIAKRLQSLARWLFPAIKWKEEAKRQQRFSEEVYVMLRRGGWYPGRSEPLSQGANESDYSETALAVLHEFGDLSFGERFPSPTDVQIYASDELEVAWLPEEWKSFQSLRLSPIGMVASQPLFIDAAGFLYLVDCDFRSAMIVPIAKSFERFLEITLRQTKPSGEDLSGAREYKHVGGNLLVFEEIHRDPSNVAS